MSNDFENLDIITWEGLEHNDMVGYSALDKKDRLLSDLVKICDGERLIGVELWASDGPEEIQLTPYFASEEDCEKAQGDIRAYKGECVTLTYAEFFKYFSGISAICFYKCRTKKRIILTDK